MDLVNPGVEGIDGTTELGALLLLLLAQRFAGLDQRIDELVISPLGAVTRLQQLLENLDGSLLVRSS